jgi:hypothetical protein
MGERFDDSSQLLQLQESVRSASPAAQWSGGAADAYDARNGDHARIIGQLARLDRRLGLHVTDSAQVVSTGRQGLDAIRSWVMAAAQSVPSGRKGERMLVPIVREGLAQVAEVVKKSNGELSAIGARLSLISDEYGDVSDAEESGKRRDGQEDRTIQAIDFKQGPAGEAEDSANRRQNQIDAFKQLYGREPLSSTDWQTAAALDPHSYDTNTDGIAPEIRVAKINPVPGQGVVRVGQWIEQRDVISGPWKRDFGNTRVADPHFDPADTKVTTYIDYENGLVVMRQNPSVELTLDGGPGQVKVGIPEATVQQSSDGAVRIKYDAANPFAPAIAQNPPWPLENNPWTVNGDLVFTPTSGGVHVDGTRTNYPSMEIYQDFPDSSSRTVLVDPAIAGNSTGPMVNLPEHHDVGAGGSAFAPFDTGTWNPDFDVRVPLPSIGLGPPENPSQVPPTPMPPGVTTL